MITFQKLDVLIPAQVIAYLDDLTLSSVLDKIANAARVKWINTAKSELHTTRQEYISGIQEVDLAIGSASIALTKEVPNLIENGMSAMDLRDTLLGQAVPVAPFGQKGKREAKAGHYYRAIPFRHAVAGSDFSVGVPMGFSYGKLGEDVERMGKAVHKAAKKLAPTIGEPYKINKWGEKLKAGLKYKNEAGEMSKVYKLKPHHKTDIYAGMTKIQKTYEKATQSQYLTFRTISQATGTGWLRPETQGKHFAEKVSAFVAEIAPKAFSDYVDGLTAPPQGGKQL